MKPRRIVKIQVEGLFGTSSYLLEPKENQSLFDERVLLLYGDNGSGKTTILKLIFFLLSPRRRRGHKTRIAHIPFKLFAIHFDDGTIVSAMRQEAVAGTFVARITQADGITTEIVYAADEAGDIITRKNYESFADALSGLNIGLYYLADNRRTRTFMHEETDESYENYGELNKVDDDPFESPVSNYQLEQAVTRLVAWFRRQVVAGSARGITDSNKIFLEVLREVSQVNSKAHISPEDYQKSIVHFNEIASELGAFTRYGLTPSLPIYEIRSVLSSAPQETRAMLTTVLNPYLESVDARLNAIRGLRNIISGFVESLSEFFEPKQVTFSIQDGLSMMDARGRPLPLRALSSGERQFLLLLASTILATDSVSIFVVDEPELSLNIKWQRKLIDVLMRCAADSDVQFIFATHSLEILSLHPNRVIKLHPIG